MKTPIQTIINAFEDKLKSQTDTEIIQFTQGLIYALKMSLPIERPILEKIFEDGVGEGLTDPERPLTGKEYYDIKFKQ